MDIAMDKGLPRVLIKQFFNYWPWYVSALTFLFFTHYVGSFLPFYAKELADLVEKSKEIPMAKFFLLALGIIIFRSSSRILFFFPARFLEKNMRIEILGRIENTPPERYQNYSPGQLFQILYNDTEQMRALVGFALLQVGNLIIALVVLVPKIYNYGPELLLALLPMLFASALFAVLVGKTRHFHRLSADYQGEVQNFIMEVYTGKKTIKNYHAELPFLEIFKNKCFKELISAYKAGISVSFSIPLIPLGVGLSFLWGAHIIFQNDMGANSLILFSGFVFLFLEPLMFISWIGIVLAASLASWGRISELLRDMKVEGSRETFLKEQDPTLEVSEGKYQMKGKFWEKVLSIGPYKNKWTVLIGKTGHGKTEILFQIAERLKQLNQKISFVAQTPYLFNDTIEANIFLGQERDQKRIDEAYELLTLFGLDFLAASKEDLMKLEVGENGKRLSGGQSKRLALVRSLMAEADFIIWDDPFSSVDVILEKQIFEELKKSEALKKKTFILTSHRVSTVRFCDELIYLDKNIGIVEEGNCSNLLSENSGSKTYEYFKKQLV